MSWEDTALVIFVEAWVLYHLWGIMKKKLPETARGEQPAVKCSPSSLSLAGHASFSVRELLALLALRAGCSAWAKGNWGLNDLW